mmetsp:Transcript_9401/g.20995  ORF Transcript_9401/g.20995 Transcript_9401/m.20995 type:complete len:220 (-) Transcript_9401:138-797(-)
MVSSRSHCECKSVEHDDHHSISPADTSCKDHNVSLFCAFVSASYLLKMSTRGHGVLLLLRRPCPYPCHRSCIRPCIHPCIHCRPCPCRTCKNGIWGTCSRTCSRSWSRPCPCPCRTRSSCKSSRSWRSSRSCPCPCRTWRRTSARSCRTSWMRTRTSAKSWRTSFSSSCSSSSSCLAHDPRIRHSLPPLGCSPDHEFGAAARRHKQQRGKGSRREERIG